MQSKKLYVETPVGGEYPPRKDKTIFAASKCADIVPMDEGAIEHPMSTHSAPFGTSWTARGWKHVALILMFLALSVGNVWGVTKYYYKITVVAVCEGDATGQVAVKSGGSSSSNIDPFNSAYDSPNSGWSLSCGSKEWIYYITSTTSTSKITLLARAGDGCVLEGWYTNEECTTQHSTQSVSSRNASCAVYVNNVLNMYTEGGIGSSNSETNPSATFTVYAKFVKEASGNKFKPQLTATSSNFSQGHIAISMTSTGLLSKVAQTAGPVDYTLTEESSLSQTFSVRAQPMRGYKFVNWTVAGNPRTTDKATSDLPLESFTVTLTDQMTPGANSVISNNDVVTANFAEDALKDFKIQKEANTGTVSGSYLYYYIISGGSSTTSSESISSMNLSDTEKNYQLYGTDKITLTATPATGYVFSGWYVRRESHPDELLSTNSTVETYLTEDNLTFVPVFALDVSKIVIGEKDNFLVGYSTCTTFEQALAAATQSQHKTILQLKDYTVPAGNYTIPAGVTLLIPYAEDQSTPATILPRVGNENAIPGNAYRTLTLSSGVKLDVYGTIEVSGRQATGVSGAGGEDGIGCPTGDYGCLYMSAGSYITLNNGALLRGWGYVLGDRDGQGKYQCEIDARRGARVQEQFQMMDWKGGTYTMGMTDGNNSDVKDPNSHRVLPVNQYYIQNVEVPVKYRPGSKLLANASVFLNGTFYGMTLNNIIFNIDNVGVIGAKYNDPDVTDDRAIFLMDNEDDSEDTWVRKYYDVANDKQVYEVNNAASLGSLVLNVLGIDVSSTEYKLPITNNFKIHLLYGNMEITQHTELLAGAEIEVNKESTLTIPSGVKLYLYDKEDWGHYISSKRNANSSFTFGSGTTVKWRPGGRPTVRRDAVTDTVVISDSKINIHGTLNLVGDLLTTSHGASITSTIADAGTVIFSTNASGNTTVSQVKSLPADASHDNAYVRIPSTSAQLKNELGTLTPTAGTTATEDAPVSFCFIDFDGDGKGEWKSLATLDCFVKDENDVWYIKPQEYVAISQGAAPVEEADHTYRDHYAGTNRIFILAAEGNCQWWEVRVVPGHPDLFECINENNHTFYYYDESAGNWMEKKFKVSWVNWDGSPVNYTNSENEQVNFYMVTYGTVPTWKSANPTHADDASHTYSFNGWLPAPAPVTEDVTYTAQYEERDRMYAITFNNESDQLIQVLYCKLGEIPECTKYDAAANNKVWKTVGGEAIGAVAGDATYKLYPKESKSSYTIRFVNWDGTVLQSGSVPAGQMPSAPATPTKDADDLHSYSFKSWNPALANADADATYTATYNAGPRGYTITWKSGDVTLDTDELAYGETPAYAGATPNKAPDEYTYTFSGWSPAIAAVTGNATYTAQFVKGMNVNVNKEIDANTTLSSISIETGKALTIAANTTVTTDQLILKGSMDASGELIATATNAKINATNAYFDLYFNTDARHWRAFGVPWVVSLDATPLTEVESGRTLVLGRDYDIIWYNTAKRASQGAGAHCWEYVEHNAHILTPGQGYMIAFTSHVNTVRFAKATGTPVLFTGTVNVSGAGSGADQGINAIANPMAYHTNMNITGVGQVHDGGLIGEDEYTPVTIANMNYIVGKTVYVQVESDQTITPTSGISPAAAPVRRAAKATDKQYMVLEDYYTIALTSTNGEEKKLYVLPEEEKEDKYVIGHDLAKMGMSTKKPQIWVKRYGVNLGLNTTAPMDGVAEFPVNLYAPTAGEYTITNAYSPNEEYVVYLTRDGKVIWNLSDSPYALTLGNGTTKGYGLRLTKKAPQVATGIDEAVVDAKGETRKVLINDQVFIIRGENVYSTDGQLVK